jgi:hypothetical protein
MASLIDTQIGYRDSSTLTSCTSQTTINTMKLMTIKLSFLATMLVLALQGGSSTNAATIVFDNIAPSTPYYNPYGNWLGTFVNQYEITATTFVPSASGPLDTLDLGLFYLNGANSVTLRLSQDSGGLPGAPIWTTSVPPAPGYGFLLSVTGIGGPTINAGQTYWLEGVAPVTPTTEHAWYVNNQGDVGPVIASGNYVANTDRFSLRVGVLSSVPEPVSCVLILSGTLGLALFRRRRR